MIRAEIVVRRTGDPSDRWTQGNRYVLYHSKKGNLVISTDKGTAIPIDTSNTWAHFKGETDIPAKAPRTADGYRIKYFKTRQDLFKYAEINENKQAKPLTKVQEQDIYRQVMDTVADALIDKLNEGNYEKGLELYEYDLYVLVMEAQLTAVDKGRKAQIAKIVNMAFNVAKEQVEHLVELQNIKKTLEVKHSSDVFPSLVPSSRTAQPKPTPWHVAPEDTPREYVTVEMSTRDTAPQQLTETAKRMLVAMRENQLLAPKVQKPTVRLANILKND